MSEQRALDALDKAGLTYRVVRHGRVASAAEAAAARGVDVGGLVKSMVVRREEGDYVFVLVPGDREISWPKLRALLDVNRLSMPDAATAKDGDGVRARHHHSVRIDHRLAGDRRRAAPRSRGRPRSRRTWGRGCPGRRRHARHARGDCGRRHRRRVDVNVVEPHAGKGLVEAAEQILAAAKARPLRALRPRREPEIVAETRR